MNIWIPCIVTEGMFPEEKCVTIEALDIGVSYFEDNIDGDMYRGNGQQRKAKVEVVSSIGEYVVVMLLRHTIERGRFIKIKKSMLIKED